MKTSHQHPKSDILPRGALKGLSGRTGRLKEELVDSPRRADQATLRNIVRDMGLKVTDQRLLILQALHSGRVHVTAQEVFEKVMKKDPTLGFATVYRFLRTLTEHGFVNEVRMGGASARYELKPEGHHDHLTCTDCGRICEFENYQIEELQTQVAAQFGFVLTGHLMELYGLCAACQTAAGKSSGDSCE